MKVLVFDSELTGFDEPEIIEAAWIELKPFADWAEAGTDDLSAAYFKWEHKYWERFQPVKPSTFGALAVHHILPEELEGRRPSCEFRLPENTGYIIGHSVDVDWFAMGQPDVKRIDTNAIARRLWPTCSGYSLGALIYMILGATPKTRELVRAAHGTQVDVHLTLIVLCEILKLKPDIKTWEQLWAYSEECRIPRTCPIKRYANVLLADLPTDFIYWCLNQHWIDPYFRRGLIRVLDDRRAGLHADLDDDEEFSDEP